MLYPDHGSDWIDEDVPTDLFPIARANLAAEANANRFADAGGTGIVLRFGWFYGPGARHSEQILAAAAGKSMWLRGPGRAALLFGDRSTSLTRSLRVCNARFRTATGWAPRYPSARDGWIATATALDQGRSEPGLSTAISIVAASGSAAGDVEHAAQGVGKTHEDETAHQHSSADDPAV